MKIPLVEISRMHRLSFQTLLLLLALACTMLLPAQSSAQTLTAGTGSGLAGTAVDLPIRLNPGSASICSLQFDFGYSAALTYVSTTPGTLPAGANVSSTSSRVIIYQFTPTPQPIANGTIVTIRFNIVAGTAPGSIPVTVSGVVASDAVANPISVSGVNGSVTVLAPADTAPPVISSVTSSGITQTAATIEWSTDIPSTSRVEYGVTANYWVSVISDSELVTSHSLTLTGLMPDTLYFYRVTSANSAGAATISGTSIFTTLHGTAPAVSQNRLYCPWISTQNLQTQGLQDEEHLGLAVANMDVKDATLTFTALASDGQRIVRSGFVNPATRILKPGAQLPIIDNALFETAQMPDTVRAIQLESSTNRIAGFFLMFDNNLTRQDGADLSATPLTTFIMPEIDAAGLTRIQVANPNSKPATISFTLMNARGGQRAGPAVRVLQQNATLIADAYRDLFPGVQPDASDYIGATSDSGVLPLELLGGKPRDIAVLNGIDANSGSTTLYAPQFVFNNAWRSSLSVINLDSIPGNVTISLIGESGLRIAEVVLPIDAKGKIRVDTPAFFGNLGDAEVQGYLRISSNGIRMAGSSTFGDRDGRACFTALPLVSDLRDSILFSHVASDDVYFTGLAIVNPNDADAIAAIVIYDEEGKIDQYTLEIIPARQRRSKVLTEYFPALNGQIRRSGYIRLMVDRGVASYALFGTKSLSVLSAMPAQAVPGR